jgi:DNA-directed RNA polymerase
MSTKRKNVLMLKPEVAALMEARHESMIEAATRYEPMVVPPTPLGYGMTDSYGYRTSNAPLRLVKSRDQGLLEEMRNNSAPEYASFMEGINGIGNSRFRVNKWLLKMLKRGVRDQGTCGKLPAFDIKRELSNLSEVSRQKAAMILIRKPADVKLNEFCDTLAEDDSDIVKTYSNDMRSKREYIQKKTELAGGRANLNRTIALAEKYQNFDQIYFPPNVDRRGRVYYSTPNLNPQGPDHEKALIELAHAERVGMKGLYWLTINVANLMGFDKADLGDRVRYVKAHWGMIKSTVASPFNDRRWETETDKPMQFLAAAKDLIDAMESDNPYDHMSRVSVALDASCSGLQILGALTKCTTSLFNTNCLRAVRDENGKLLMQDIYRRAADKATMALILEAEGGEHAEIAQAILSWAYAIKDGKLTRDMLKRNTMTYFYGSKANGMGQQLMDDHFEIEYKKALDKVGRDGDVTSVGFPFADKKHRIAASQYLAKVNFAAIEAIAPIPALVMKSLQKYGQLISKGGKKMRWTTPLGFIVEQHYEVQKDLVVDSILTGQQRKPTSTRKDTGVVDQNKQKLGAAPNFVHSLDSSLLLKAVCEGVRGQIMDWRVVHDSFAVSARQTSRMARLLKNVMADMFSADVLSKVAAELDAQVPEELRSEIIPFPEYGDADINEIRKAELPFC